MCDKSFMEEEISSEISNLTEIVKSEVKLKVSREALGMQDCQ